MIDDFRARPETDGSKTVMWCVRFWLHGNLEGTECVNYPLENHPDPENVNFLRGAIVDATEDLRAGPPDHDAVTLDGPFLISDAAPPTIQIFGSCGTLSVDARTGFVMHYDQQDGDESDPAAYNDIVRFDLDEWRKHYPGETCEGGDILDFAYWNADDSYEEAEADWRARRSGDQ